MSGLPRIMSRLLAFCAVLGLLGLAVMAAGWVYLSPGLPSAETLREVPLQIPLRVFSRDGRLMAQVGEKRRIPVTWEEIPELVANAFIAAEDDRFYKHPGFDYQGIARAAFKLATTGTRAQGGSTITQQLARNYFLTRERKFERKAREIILAVRIEQEFTKQEILTLYLNKIFLGQRSYGVAAAAEVYFGKRLDELSIAEAATIAGLPKAPSKDNPVTDPDAAVSRRAYVLRRMRELGFIDQAQLAEAMAEPMVSRLHGPRVELDAPYVVEMVRRAAVERFGLSAYSDGYQVITTVDSRLQEAADRALRTGLLEYDWRHGYRGPALRGLIEEGEPVPSPLELNLMIQDLASFPDLAPGVVIGLNEDDSALVWVRGHGDVQVPWENLRRRPWVSDSVVGSRPETVADIINVGDAIYLLRTENRGWLLGQVPEVQGAVVSLDPRDGATVALAGGFDFYDSKFNRAVQARRQPGSSFKPFIYSAALNNGFTTASIVNDAPVVFDSSGQEVAWRPKNHSGKFYGPTRLREGLVRSMNLVSVRLLLGTGVSNTLRHLGPFGFPETVLPRDPSLALGSGAAAPWEIASGYAVFANGGHRVDHHIIDRILMDNGETVWESDARRVCDTCLEARDARTAERDMLASIDPQAQTRFRIATEPGETGEVPTYPDARSMIEQASAWRPDAEETPNFWLEGEEPAPQIISPQNAYLVYDMMRDVIRRGTGRRARELGRNDLAGKTGTSNERRDAWFSGFNGDLVTTVWVGFDQERSLGAGEEGGRTALPVWKYYMAEALEGQPERPLNRPPGIVTARISPETGMLARAGETGAIFEIFEADHVPASPESTPGSGSLDPFDSDAGEEEELF